MASTSPWPIPVFSSMEALPQDSPLRKLYPENTYANGNYYASPNGRIRYSIIGPDSGDKVTLIHGISIPSIAYQKVAQYLVDQGYCVLVYDLYGRGYSEAPKRTLETNDYIVQLVLLLQYVGWSSAKVVGFSMGGGIAAAFASSFPHLIDGKVIFIASAGLIEILTSEDGVRRHMQPRKSADPNHLAVELCRLQEEALPSYKTIMDNDRERGPIAGMEWAFKSLDQVETKGGKLHALIIHGTHDDIVPISEAFKIKEHIPQAEIVQVKGAYHYLLMQEEHAIEVAESIAKFLRD